MLSEYFTILLERKTRKRKFISFFDHCVTKFVYYGQSDTIIAMRFKKKANNND